MTKMLRLTEFSIGLYDKFKTEDQGEVMKFLAEYEKELLFYKFLALAAIEYEKNQFQKPPTYDIIN